MKNITAIVCAVFIISVESECENSKCAHEIIKDILKEKSVVEDIDIKLEVPKFQQIKNVGIEDLNEILLHLTSWFEKRLNDTNFIFKHVHNKTKVFVKSFDFNVDFEKGNAKIDVDLTEEPEDKKEEISLFPKEHFYSNEDITTTPTKIVTNRPKKVVHRNKTAKIQRIINKLGGLKENDVFKLEEFDTAYYDDEDNSTDYPILDYVEIYKDTTNEEKVFTSTELPPVVDDIITGIYETEHKSTEKSVQPNSSDPDYICNGDVICKDFAQTVFPWIVTIFVTNDTKDSQFSYYCDGALLSDKVILTAGRCMIACNKTWEPDNVFVFLGKGNLQTFGGNEKVQRIKDVVIHPNFTVDAEGRALNDLALLVLEDSVEFRENIQSACIHQEDTIDEAATTAWGPNGALLPIFFNKERSEMCFNKDQDIFCVTYGNEIALCPSYGGVYVSRQGNRWCLQGIFYGDPADRGICFVKDVFYTSLKNYLKWIVENVEVFRNDIL